MSSRTLGIDLGTNSIGWAVTERLDGNISLIDAGIHIFQEGVPSEKGKETPQTVVRTAARASRRHYFRRRLMKIELLKVLIRHGLCPALTDNELELWRKQKKYPMNEDFIKWQRTDDNLGKNPYADRHVALTEKLDLNIRADRFRLGRALYHLAQRRGFLSNRKDVSESSEGEVKQAIDLLTKNIEESEFRFSGEYFYHLYQTGGKIRCKHLHRTQHIEAEFNAICEKQGLSRETVNELHRAIFFQRPLKSQKGLIGHCTFESSKQKAAVSHPEFEEFRMLSFINNIKLKSPDDYDFRVLSEEEKEKIKPLFFRKSKESFPFEDIAKKIAGAKNYCFRDEKGDLVKFNYRMATSVSGCPVTASLMSLFGNDWKQTITRTYRMYRNKSERDMINDVWHSLFSFDSDKELAKWAMKNLSLDEENAEKFASIRTPQGFAALSLKAIRKIVPFLRNGLRYDEAVFVANIPAVLKNWELRSQEEKENITDEVRALIDDFQPTDIIPTKYDAVKGYLEELSDVDYQNLDKLYHPSKIDIYPEAIVNKKGELLLGSPRTDKFRNPMVFRTLFRLRDVINTLLREGIIDRTAKINIEFSRMLNNANMRGAIRRLQRENEKNNKTYSDEIRNLYKEETGLDIEPTERDILKYSLWIEQGKICLYTGKQIGIADFLGSNPKFDIEHTIPRSAGGDDSKANKTLCDLKYNREVKRTVLPANLADKPVIMANIDKIGWEKEIRDLENRIAKKKVSGYMTKEMKDNIIQERNYLKLKLNYLKDKFSRFTMTEVPSGFTNRQGVDIGIIGKYAREYLRSLFHSDNAQIFTVKGETTSEFRQMWGLQEEFTKKERVNHTHHTIDAVVISCIGREEYRRWAEYKRQIEEYDLYGGRKPVFEKPWITFTEDIKALPDRLLVSHNNIDRRLKPSRKKLRKRNRIQTDEKGNILYQQGDSARAQLHKETFYGAIKINDEIKYVVRKKLSDLAESDIEKIVDPVVRGIVKAEVELRGFKNLCSEPVYMNREKGIEIKSVRIFTPSIKNPIHLKPHRDVSDKPYKRDYYVTNDGNYCLGIYEGTDNKGKTRRSFILASNLEAVKKAKAGEDILPLSDSSGYPLKYTLKPGIMVLLYQDSPQEIYEASPVELTKRLYKVTGLSSMTTNGCDYGVVTMRFHQEARPGTELTIKKGGWKNNEEIRPVIGMSHIQFNALVEGTDFILTPTGKIRFLNA